MAARPQLVVVGAGPAGLAAAERLAPHASVTVLERMPSPGRKFLLAGRGGLNLTHSEPIEAFLPRYGVARSWLEPAVHGFGPDQLRAWAEELGQPCFTGSSGRVFPRAMKASPLLRAWLARLDGQGVALRTRCRLLEIDRDGTLGIETPTGRERLRPDGSVLALGGASWARLGSDGTWTGMLAEQELRPFRPNNCGFLFGWSAWFRARFAGTPLKSVGLRFEDATARGDLMLTAGGIEGGPIYPLSAALRDRIAADGAAILRIDLRPELSVDAVAERLGRTRERESLSKRLRKAVSLDPASIALLREASGVPPPAEPRALAAMLKAVPLVLRATDVLDRAISTGGGVVRAALDDRFMLRSRSGVFLAGEMLDWEAPTGGYLLQGAISTGRAAAGGLLEWLGERRLSRSPAEERRPAP